MPNSPLQRRLTVIILLAGVVYVAQTIWSKVDLFDYARFALFAWLLGLLAWGAVQARSTVPRHAEPDTPAPAWAAALARLAHPGWLVLLLVLGLAWFALRMRVMSCDEGIWYYVARAWRHFGMLPYLGTVENKTPGIFYLFALCDAGFGLNYLAPRALGILATAGAAWGVYILGVRLHGRATGLWALLIFTLVSFSRTMDPPLSSQTESFMLAGSVAAAYAVARVADARTRAAHLGWLLLAGACLGAAIAFKQIAVLTAAGLLCVYLARPRPFARTGWAVARDVAVVAAGMLLATAVSIVPLLLAGVPLRAYLDGAWLILTGAGTSAGSGTLHLLRGIMTANALHVQLALLLALVLLALRTRLAAQRATLFGLLGWFACDFLAVNATGTYYGHQLRQMLPTLALLGGIALTELFAAQWAQEPLGHAHRALAAVAVVLLWCPVFTTIYRSVGRAPALMATATYVKARTAPTDYVYSVGNVDNNPILALTERRSSSRYFNQFFCDAPGATRQWKRDLNAHPPAYIVLQLNRLMSLQPIKKIPSWFEVMLIAQYDRVQMFTFTEETPIDPAALGGYIIYRRLPESDLRKMTPRGKDGSVRAMPFAE
jgi:hypothetical protein